MTVKGYVDRVEVIGDGTPVATHPRSYQRGEKILDPLHFLGTLARKPAALDHAPVYRDWRLPRAFAELRAALEGRLGSCVGTRHYIRVLQLLTNHPVDHVEAAAAGCLSRGELDAGLITAAVRQIPRGDAPPSGDNGLSLDLAAVAVRPTELAQFDRLLSHSPEEGEAHECRNHTAVAPGQPEATEVADHARRVGEARP